jgi:hypothetical protein
MLGVSIVEDSHVSCGRSIKLNLGDQDQGQDGEVTSRRRVRDVFSACRILSTLKNTWKVEREEAFPSALGLNCSLSLQTSSFWGEEGSLG